MGTKVSILIVEDSLAICQLLIALLNECGVTDVEFCHSGDEAFWRVNESPAQYDAIFVDLHLDGMDGLELMAKLNEIHYHGGIIVMSSLDKKIVEFTLAVISSYNLRVLGSAAKPFEKSLIAFMVKRIQSYRPFQPAVESMIRRRELKEGIEDKKILTYFQPKLSSVDCSLVGLECLIRLDVPGRGIVFPNRFIPVAERFNLIDPLLRVTLEEALPKYQQFIEETDTDASLSINISPLHLYSDVLPELISEYVDQYHIDKSKICLEITENHAIHEEKQLKNLNRLRIHGFSLSLDDYGAGYTNIKQLYSLPFNEIKLDSKLIDGVHSDQVLQIIVESIKKVCDEIEVTLVAEGIDNTKDLSCLNSIGIDAYQGYLFCRPKPLDELLRWHRVWTNTLTESSVGLMFPNAG